MRTSCHERRTSANKSSANKTPPASAPGAGYKWEKEAIADAKAGNSSAKVQSFAKLRFAEAGERHVKERLAHLAQRSIETAREHLRPRCKISGKRSSTALRQRWTEVTSRSVRRRV